MKMNISGLCSAKNETTAREFVTRKHTLLLNLTDCALNVVHISEFVINVNIILLGYDGPMKN